MAQAIPTTPQVTSIRGKVHINEPVNPLSIVRITKEESRWDGREYEGYPCILIEIEDEGKQKWFYAKGDEATRDADYIALDAMINNLASGLSPLLYDAVVDAGGGGDYLLPSAAIAGGACSMFVRAGIYNEVDDVVLTDFCKIVGETSGSVIIFPAGKGIVSTIGGTLKTAGNIAATNGSATILGAGTSFDGGDVGSYLNIGLDFFKVVSFVSATEITIENPYKGDTDPVLTYKLSPMVVGVTIQTLNLQGGGVSSELIYFNRVLYSTIKEVLANDANSANILLEDCGAIDLENVISRNSATASAGVGVIKSIGIKIAESSFNNNGDNGLNIASSKGVTVDHCFASNNFNNGVELVASTDIVLSDMQAWNNNQRGIEILSNSSAIVLDTCNFQNNALGISNDSERAIISNCYISNSVTGIICLGESKIENNFIENITGIGISMSLGSDSSNVTGNTFKDCGTGINVTTNNSNYALNTLENCAIAFRLINADNNIVSSNRLSGTGNLLYTVEPGSTGNKLLGNVGTIRRNGAIDTEIEGVIYNDLSTTDATPTTISTIPIPTDDTQYLFDVVVTAMSTDEVDFGIWKRTLVVKRIAGVTTISLFNADVDSQTNLLPASITAGVSGANIDIQATGVVNTINWVGGHKSLSQSPTP